MRKLITLLFLVGVSLYSISTFSSFSEAAFGDLDDWHSVNSEWILDKNSFVKTVKWFDGEAYIAYTDNSAQNKISVVKYDFETLEFLGEENFSPIFVSTLEMEISPSGVPYIAFNDSAHGKVSVMRFNGTEWEYVGNPGFPLVSPSEFSFALDGDTPYIVYRASSQGNKATVMKFTGSAWETVGSAAFTSSGAWDPDIVAKNGNVYIAFSDDSVSAEGTVLTFNGTNWVPVGTPGFTSGYVAFIDIELSQSGVLYATVNDWSLPGDIAVLKYNGTEWEYVGPEGNIHQNSNNTSASKIYINNDVPYLNFVEFASGGNNIIHILRFDGTSWNPVGSQFASGYQSSGALSFNETTPYLLKYDSSHEQHTFLKHGQLDEWTTEDQITETESGKPIVLSTPEGTNITCNSNSAVSSENPDSGHEYPLGLVNFCYSTTNNDDQISITFVTDLTPEEVVARKFYPSTGMYADLPGATVTETAYGGEHALRLQYTITDNGELDLNPAVGVVEDPVGLAITVEVDDSGGGEDNSDSEGETPGAPNTGVRHITTMKYVASILTGTLLMVSGYSLIRRRGYVESKK